MDKQRAKDIIACRCAQELKDGYVVNLGIGIPTQCARYFPEGVDITLHAELGLIGQGPAPTPEQADPLHVVDASGNPAKITAISAFLATFTASFKRFSSVCSLSVLYPFAYVTSASSFTQLSAVSILWQFI